MGQSVDPLSIEQSNCDQHGEVFFMQNDTLKVCNSTVDFLIPGRIPDKTELAL